MKIFKPTLLLVLAFMANIAFAQDEKKSVMYTVHTDNVKFEKLQQYEEAIKEFNQLFIDNNIQGTSWSAYSLDDGRYVYSTQIENFADLDKDFFGSIAEKEGEEKINKIFEKMGDCYDSHSDNIFYYLPELSYYPEGYSTEGKNFR